MFYCVLSLFLAVLGTSTCYRRDDYAFPSHPTYPSHQPSQWGPGHGSPGGRGSWHHGYHNGFGWFSPGSEDSQWPNGQKVGGSHYDPSGFYDEGSSSDDQVKNPFRPNKGLDATLQGKKPDGSGKEKQDGNNKVYGDDQVNRPINFNIQEPVNCQNDTSEPENVGKGDFTGHIAVAIPKPFQFDNRYDGNRGDIPAANINKRTSNITQHTEKNNHTGNLDFMPLANRTSGLNAKPLQSNLTKESNETLTQAYITGPDNTLADFKGNQTVTNGPSIQDTFIPSTEAPLRNTSETTDHVVMDYDYAWAEPDPSTGSVPVPLLDQLLAPALQWNVGIYTKTETPYSQICGGSLVKTDVVITAAHCFWADGGALRPALFAAAAGKLQRSWDAASDAFAQQSDIRELHIPPRFQGAMTSFQDDIAVARLSSPFEYGPGVKPVCLDFDPGLEREHLKAGGKGTMVGWGLTEPNGGPSERLNFVQLPYLEIAQCIPQVQPTFLKYITSDKICAGDFISGSAACKGDSGSGLVFTTNGIPYLRGIASTAPRDGNQCNAFTPATFTHISAHTTFLADHIPNIDEDCRSLYDQVRNTTVETDGYRNDEMVVNSTVPENNQIKFNVTVQSAEGKLQGPMPLPLTSSRQAYNCNCICNL